MLPLLRNGKGRSSSRRPYRKKVAEERNKHIEPTTSPRVFLQTGGRGPAYIGVSGRRRKKNKHLADAMYRRDVVSIAEMAQAYILVQESRFLRLYNSRLI